MDINFSKSKILKIPKIKKSQKIKKGEDKKSKGEGIGVGDFPKICFGDFLDDLFKNKVALNDDKSGYVPIIDLHVASPKVEVVTPVLLLDEWMSNLDGSTNYFSHLRNGNSKDYKIGNNAIDGFFESNNDTKRKLIDEIASVIDSLDVDFHEKAFRSYILSIIDLKFPNEMYTYIKNQHIEDGDSEETAIKSAKEIKSRYENRLNNYIGGNEEKEEITKTILNLLDLAKYAEVLALFVLAFIILQKYDINYGEQNHRDALKRIWFDLENTKGCVVRPTNALSEILKDYELPAQIEEFSLKGESYKQDCYVINGKIDKMKSIYRCASLQKTISLSDYKEMGAVISTAKEGYKVKFLLFGKDNNGNLEDCINLIDMLHKFRYSHDSERKKVAENIDIYVCADFDFASTLIDSAINTIDDVYYRVHICDYNKMVAQKLISEAPVFLPRLIDGSDVNIVIIGINEGTLQLAEEIVASSFMPNVPKVSLVGNNSVFYKQKFKQKLPGVYKTETRIKRIVPDFYECNVECADFLELLTASLSVQDDTTLSDALAKGTYFVVDIGNDRDSILFARNLRAWLLSCDENFSRTPFIAVKCEDERNANVARHLVVNNKKSGKDYFNNYNLFFYGMKDTVFNFDYMNIENNRQKQIALNIHFSYYANNLSDKDKADALESYFRFSYNRDSSECASIAIVYMLYSLGIIKTSDDLKCDEKSLAEKYEKWLQDHSNKEAAARYEHSRWIGFMLARGWRAATLGQVIAYSGQESGKDHKQTLCKLHPFICQWDDFDGKAENLKFDALRAVNKNLKTPVDSTYNIVSAIGKILTNNPFAYEELETDETG